MMVHRYALMNRLMGALQVPNTTFYKALYNAATEDTQRDLYLYRDGKELRLDFVCKNYKDKTYDSYTAVNDIAVALLLNFPITVINALLAKEFFRIYNPQCEKHDYINHLVLELEDLEYNTLVNKVQFIIDVSSKKRNGSKKFLFFGDDGLSCFEQEQDFQKDLVLRHVAEKRKVKINEGNTVLDSVRQLDRSVRKVAV